VAQPRTAPKRQPRPAAQATPEQTAATGGAGAAAAAAAAAALAATAAPALPPLTAAGLGAAVSAQVLQAAGQVMGAVDVLFRRRRAEVGRYVAAVVEQEMPHAPVSRIEQLAQIERQREAEFQRRARQRLSAELPLALQEADPATRKARVNAVVEREKRYLQQRTEAAATRVVAALEADLVRELSPEGAYWQLSPLVREHTLDCLAMAGSFWPWSVLERWHPQLHVGCFPAGVIVDAPGREGVTRRWWNGDLVRLVLADGQELPVTPNHPVLTPRGWVAAGELREGDDVICREATDRPLRQQRHDHENMPARIEQVFDATLLASGAVLSGVPSTPVDFHGDGLHGHVDVVRAAGDLRAGGLTTGGEQDSEVNVVLADGARIPPEPLDGERPSLPFARRSLPATGRGISSRYTLSPLLRRAVGGEDTHLLGRRARRDTLGAEATLDYVAGYAVAVSERFHGLSLPVRLYDGAGVERQPLGHGQGPSALGTEQTVESPVADAVLAQQLLNGDSGPVIRQQVVAVNRRRFSGHVYNLDSGEGWYSSNSVIVHNCQCRLLGLQEAERAGLMTGEQLPDPVDAMIRAQGLMAEANRLMESLAPEELDKLIAELEDTRLQEARRKLPQRWAEGTVKGGEFKAKRGSDAGRKSKGALKQLSLGDLATRTELGAVRRVTIRGQDREVPEGAHWEERIDGTRFTSPAGGTNLYRDGKLIDGDHPDLGGVPESQAEEPPPMPTGDPIPDYTGVKLAIPEGKEGHAGGTTGARVATDEQGRKWLVKTYGGSRDRVATELLANAVYRAMGAGAADAGTLREGDAVALTYPLVDGEVREQKYGKPDAWGGPSRKLGDHYMTDALVGNWDFVGLTRDNVLWQADPGDPDGEPRPVRIDQGGTFQYRAQGAPKPYGPVPTEVWTMRSPKGQGFGTVAVSESGMRDQARGIGDTMTDARVDQLVDAAPFADEQMREEIRGGLKARVQWMREFADGDVDMPRPLDGARARRELLDNQQHLDVLPEEHAALADFTEGAREAVNAHLRSGADKSKTTQDVRDTVGALDAVLKQAVLEDDVYAYMSYDAAKHPNQEALFGRNLVDKGYGVATFEPTSARGAGTIRVTIPAGARALYVQGVDGLEDAPDDVQLVLPRGAKVRVMGAQNEQLEAVVLP
jgi:hypothetical protein